MYHDLDEEVIPKRNNTISELLDFALGRLTKKIRNRIGGFYFQNVFFKNVTSQDGKYVLILDFL